MIMVKRLLNNIIDVCLSLFIVYAFTATFSEIARELNKLLNIDNSEVLALAIMSIFIYGYIKKYQKEQEKTENLIRLCNSVQLLDYSNLENIEKILIDREKCLAILRNGSTRTISKDVIPKTQEELVNLDKNI